MNNRVNATTKLHMQKVTLSVIMLQTISKKFKPTNWLTEKYLHSNLDFPCLCGTDRSATYNIYYIYNLEWKAEVPQRSEGQLLKPIQGSSKEEATFINSINRKLGLNCYNFR